LDEAKKMRHWNVRRAPLPLDRRDHRTAMVDHRRTYFLLDLTLAQHSHHVGA
jgi:hypothetical protein